MPRDDLVAVGAFALYRFELCHRVAEFEKDADAGDLIARDFEQFRAKYVRKFTDIIESMEKQGMTVAFKAACTATRPAGGAARHPLFPEPPGLPLDEQRGG